MKALLILGMLSLFYLGANLPNLHSIEYTIKEFDRATTCPKCKTKHLEGMPCPECG